MLKSIFESRSVYGVSCIINLNKDRKIRENLCQTKDVLWNLVIHMLLFLQVCRTAIVVMFLVFRAINTIQQALQHLLLLLLHQISVISKFLIISITLNIFVPLIPAQTIVTKITVASLYRTLHRTLEKSLKISPLLNQCHHLVIAAILCRSKKL